MLPPPPHTRANQRLVCPARRIALHPTASRGMRFWRRLVASRLASAAGRAGSCCVLAAHPECCALTPLMASGLLPPLLPGAGLLRNTPPPALLARFSSSKAQQFSNIWPQPLGTCNTPATAAGLRAGRGVGSTCCKQTQKSILASAPTPRNRAATAVAAAGMP